MSGVGRVSGTSGRRSVRVPFDPHGAGARGTPLTLALVVLVTAAAVVAAVGYWVQEGLPLGVSQRLYPLEYRAEIAQAAARYGVDPYLVAAVVKAESGFEADAVSRAGAVGLMQLMPETAGWIAAREGWERRPELTDPEDNLALGTYYLAYLLDRFEGDLATALAAYNAGEGVVDGWLRDASAADREASGPVVTLDVESIPFPETQGFVERVERFRSLYRDVHPEAFAGLERS